MNFSYTASRPFSRDTPGSIIPSNDSIPTRTDNSRVLENGGRGRRETELRPFDQRRKINRSRVVISNPELPMPIDAPTGYYSLSFRTVYPSLLCPISFFLPSPNVPRFPVCEITSFDGNFYPRCPLGNSREFFFPFPRTNA